jgi:prophage regulatory protein
MDDMLDRLKLDPGRRTIGELVQERQWALSEILRLRAELGRFRVPAAGKTGASRRQSTRDSEPVEPVNPLRFVRAKELKAMIGLSQSTIWKMTKEGRLPKPVHLSARSTAWRLADIMAWQDSLTRSER